MSMLWRNWLAFVAVLATVLAILSTLSILQYDAVLTRLIQERLAVVAETTAASLRPVINLGLPISTLRNARDVLASAKAIDPAVDDIEVFHTTGIVVHTTTEEKRDTLPASVLLAQSLSTKARWTTRSSDELAVGLSLFNRSGQPIGGVLVSAGSADFAAKSNAMARRIAAAAGVIFVLFSLIALAMLRLGLGGAIRGLQTLEKLSRTVGDGGRGTEADPARRESGSTVAFGILSGEIVRLENQLHDAFEQYRTARRALANAAGDTTPPAAPADAGGTILASVPETSIAREFARRLTPLILIVILGAALCLGLSVHREVTRSFEPELAARTKVIGTVANANIQRAINAGVPLSNLVGAEEFFEDLLEHFPEVSYFGVATGRIVYEAGNRQNYAFSPERSRKDVPTFPITADGEQIGYIIVDANPRYFNIQFRNVLLDFGVVILVVLLLAYQIMIVVMSRSMTAPFMRLQHLAGLQAAGDFSKVIAASGATAIDRLTRHLTRHAFELHRLMRAALAGASGTAERALAETRARFKLTDAAPKRLLFSYLNDVRLPLFLFATADELPLAFFPIFTRAAENPLTWLDQGLVISLPLAGYLVAISFGSPLARPLAERFGHRALFILAVILAAIAYVGLYLSTNVTEIVAWRTVSGLGFALATLCCQDYVLDVVPKADRARSLGLFTGAFFSGIFAGAALGGVLADRLGQHEVFAVAAALALFSGALIHWMLPARDRQDGGHVARVAFPPIWRPMASRRFAALVVGLAIPSNIMLQAFISFFVALQLNALGASAADTGRILMTYYLGIVFVGPAVPRLLGTHLGPAAIGTLGSLLSAASIMVFVVWPTELAMLVAVAGTGIAHALVRDPLVNLAMDIAESDLRHLGANAVLGSLRTLERIGSIAGLLALAALSSVIGYAGAMAAIAALVLAGVAIFAAGEFSARMSSRSPQPEES